MHFISLEENRFHGRESILHFLPLEGILLRLLFFRRNTTEIKCCQTISLHLLNEYRVAVIEKTATKCVKVEDENSSVRPIAA